MTQWQTYVETVMSHSIPQNMRTYLHKMNDFLALKKIFAPRSWFFTHLASWLFLSIEESLLRGYTPFSMLNTCSTKHFFWISPIHPGPSSSNSMTNSLSPNSPWYRVLLRPMVIFYIPSWRLKYLITFGQIFFSWYNTYIWKPSMPSEFLTLLIAKQLC
jgi:hypothetical protein